MVFKIQLAITKKNLEIPCWNAHYGQPRASCNAILCFQGGSKVAVFHFTRNDA